MIRDTIFLLKRSFSSEAGTAQFCPDCMLIEGVLAAHGDRMGSVKVVHVDFPRPRTGLVEIVGEDRQGCPCLVRQREGEVIEVISEPRDILAYLHRTYDIPAARGLVS